MFGPYIDLLLRKYVGREGIRKGMVGELLILFLFYMGISAVFTIWQFTVWNVKKGAQGKKDDQSQQPVPQGQQQPQPPQKKQSRLAINITEESKKRFDKQFVIFYAHHLIAMGFSLLYGGQDIGIVVSYIHLFFFFGIIVSEIMDLRPPFKLVKKICVGLCYICNLILLISAMSYLGDLKVNWVVA